MNFRFSALGTLTKVTLIAITLACSHIVEASALLSDDFNPATVESNPVWRFYDPYNIDNDTDDTTSNEPDESTLIYEGGNALINIPDGVTHDLWTASSNSNKAPRLLQTAADTDFEIQVKFETEPKIKHQLQGIIVQQTDDIFLRFDIFYNENEIALLVAYVDNTTGTVIHGPDTILTAFPNYQKVKRSGINWIFSYSSNGSTWTDISITQDITVTAVGVFAGTAALNPKFLSSIDYFIDLEDESPTIDIDTWTPPVSLPPEINTWYAQPTIQFGQAGISQKWANILGNVSSEINISTLSYTINGGSDQPLAFGADGFRLEKKGDFNIEIDHTTLAVGPNTIVIKAKDSDDQITTKTVTLDYAPADIGLPPYTADWGLLDNNIQNVESIAHIVDGLWELPIDGSGIRTKETGYDRAISIGDETWLSDNNEVTVPFIPHGNFAGIGFGVGWQGHEINQHEQQSPRVGWPVHALAWVRGSISNPSLEIIRYGELPSSDWEVPVGNKKVLAPLIPNQTYMLKSYSQSLGNGMSTFYVKFWKEGDAEPDAWDIQADVPTRDGSILLVAYRGDVTFGNVSIIEQTPTTSPRDPTPLVISKINVMKTSSKATISWETDEPANSVVDYGMTNSYGININDSTQTKTHSLTLTGLNSNTTYHYRVKSADSSNNMANSEDRVFTTNTGITTTHLLPHNQWHQVSLPMDPGSSNTVDDIFGDDGLGNYGTDWVVFRYDTSINGYVGLTVSDIMSQGVGYWIIQFTGIDQTLDMPEASTPTPTAPSMACPTGACAEIQLDSTAGTNQFNMIGYPFEMSGDLNNVRVATTVAPCEAGCTVDIAEAKGILHNQLWTYNGTEYIIVDTANGNLDPWQGFWVAVLSKADRKNPSFIVSKP